MAHFDTVSMRDLSAQPWSQKVRILHGEHWVALHDQQSTRTFLFREREGAGQILDFATDQTSVDITRGIHAEETFHTLYPY